MCFDQFLGLLRRLLTMHTNRLLWGSRFQWGFPQHEGMSGMWHWAEGAFESAAVTLPSDLHMGIYTHTHTRGCSMAGSAYVHVLYVQKTGQFAHTAIISTETWFPACYWPHSWVCWKMKEENRRQGSEEQDPADHDLTSFSRCRWGIQTLEPQQLDTAHRYAYLSSDCMTVCSPTWLL